MAKFEGGIFSDCSLQDIPVGSYAFAKNIIDGNLSGVKENEDGFTQVGLLAPYTVIGIAPIGVDFVVFSTDNTHSEIGLVTRSGSTLTYTSKYNDSGLNFNTSYPILKTEYRTDVNNQRSIAWTDNYNTPRIINIDNIASISSVNDLSLFQDINNPTLNSSTINDSGGALKTGAYVVITKYKDNVSGASTNWFVHDHVFYINQNSKSLAFNLDDGSTGGLTSNKSITLTFTGCDTRYDTLEIGYIYSSNGVITSFDVTSTTNASTVNTTLTGNESATSIAIDEILIATSSYNTAKTLTQLAGRLFLGNLTAEAMPALQQAALNVKIDWTSSLIDVVSSNINNHKDNTPPTLIPGEVYALYLGVELNKGGWRLYHIPGRAKYTNTETDTLSSDETGLPPYLRYQVKDTINTVPGVSNCGYWENENETYPNTSDFNNGTVDLRNQKVRHHRMPSLSYLSDVNYSSDGTFGITKLPVLSITASNVIIPVDIQSKIKRWKIFYAKKNDGDKIILGSDLLMNAAVPQGDVNIRWSSGGNWQMDSYYSGGGADKWTDFSSIDKTFQRGHSLELNYNRSSPTPTYAEFAYKLTRFICDNSTSSVRYNGFRSAGTIISNNGDLPGTGVLGTCNSAVLDYTISSAVTRSTGLTGFRRLDSFTFTPQNSQTNIGTVTARTLYTENCFVAQIYNPNTSWVQPCMIVNRGNGEFVYDNMFAPIPGGPATVAEDTVVMNYCRLLSSVHSSFTNQTTIPLEGYATPSTTSSSFTGGDGFTCYLSFLTAAPICSNPDTGQVGQPSIEGVRIWRGYLGYSRKNFNYRQQTAGDLSTYYYGKTDPRSLVSPVVNASGGHTGVSYTSLIDSLSPLNVIEYNIDYNQLNEYNVPVIFSPTLVQETILPNTIIFSPVQSEESKVTSWRTFLSGDRYVLTKNKGPISNLQGLNNQTLLMHTEHSLFKTRTDIQVATASENVFFKTADIFSLTPEELIPVTSGYAGTQNQLSCKLTKAGYFFIDSNQGKLFLYSGELQEISSNGLRNFFKDFTDGFVDQDNPFTAVGYTTGYDERSNRLITSKKDGDQSWTLSYNTQKKTWICYHDYIPDYMWNTVDNVLYSVKDNKFYIHNILDGSSTKGTFYDNVTYSSYIDIPFNYDQKDKLFTELEWVTEVYPNSYVSGQPSSTLSYSTTLTHLTIRSLDHCTGRVQLTPDNDFNSLYQSNTRNLNRTWYFNDIRDIVAQPGFVEGFYNNFDIDTTKLDTNPVWYNTRRFIDKFIICRLEYDNTVNNRCLLLSADIKFDYPSK